VLPVDDLTEPPEEVAEDPKQKSAPKNWVKAIVEAIMYAFGIGGP
jgi:hypothetical protein